ncbi:MAG: chromosome segregation protein SMC [Gammaproteobacteria bacterium]|nr:chromosome segregation protein SMC [Gammaproteobacteria bacterium]
MQLNKIKLSGFKSFVDPTSVQLPSNLVAVVGPNGCGKSNIIDAITWVMGESSAKQLRGELLTDVIFNGSSTRKPIGQASVELVFDNQDGTLGGEYSNYAEISIKRVINRGSDSGYFLNGARCRRRDIIDIFLGTGLGPRSYSIIGQNTISRLIEARPEEMRVFLEEAAGISKYKERRRETENRIQHTKENLDRLNDLRTELDKQLGTLKRQAGSAERFKILKEEERTLRSQWYAVQWRQIDARLVQYTLQVQQQETGVEARHAELGEIDSTLEGKRHEQQLASESFHEVQRRYYASGNDITRMEQDIRHHQERQRQWQMDLEQVDKDWRTAVEQLQELEDQLEELATEGAELEPALREANAVTAGAVRDLATAEESTQVWQANWDEFNQFAAKTTQTAQVEQTRIQHLEQKLISLKQSLAKLAQEQEQFNFADLEKELEALSEQLIESHASTEEQTIQLEDIRENLTTLQATQQQCNVQLDKTRSELQKLRGQQASLEALQQTALGQRNDRLVQWLSQHELDQNPRLAQGVEVQSGWECAVEKVLGASLQAVCVDNIADVAAHASDLKEGSLSLFATQTKSAATTHKATSLLSKIKSEWSLDSILSGIYVADTLEEALKLSETLDTNESVITPEGIWLSATWLRLSRDENPAAGIFQREQELKQLGLQIEHKTLAQESLEEELEQARDTLKTLEQQREQLQRTANQSHAQAAEIEARVKVKRERLAELKTRADRIVSELDECTGQLEDTQADLATARSSWQNAMAHLEQQTEKRESLMHEREQTRATLQAARDKVNQSKDHASELQIRSQTTQSQQSSLKQTANHVQTQLSGLAKRKTSLQNELESVSSIVDQEKALAVALENRLGIETQLNSARLAMESLEQDTRLIEGRRQALEREISKIRDVLETLRLECQGLKVKAEGLLEQMTEIGVVLEEILQTLAEDAQAEHFHAELEQVLQRIARLGPINLVAIEEYATCSERKEYLDKQYNDLQEGLATLENAIAKIDKETRAKFKETFDKVNGRFQELFPTIFAGGKAYLELTGENLLDAGITVMACPPGKRNSTIHLLSGGEKALTAIALVFSIFHLNPAPFCLLDEVDAPLDDANIGRFCQLVKTMSEKTQFIFISHNKLAIEMAKHLIGVTMHEPGVSRLVSVNVEEAITLAGA